ncbi:MAG: TetR/AcrR family transcriptional regulator [Actinomycetota bacterium]
MTPRAATKASYHHGSLESALVDAAITLVRKYGPDQLSLRAVSAEIGVSPSASYHHFRDKDALVTAISNVLFDRLAAMQEKAIAKVKGNGATAAVKKFEEMGNAYFAWATSEPNLYRLMFGGYCEINMEEHDSKSWNLLREALDELMAHGVIDKSARNGGEVIAWSAVHGASSLAIEGLIPASDFPMVQKSIQRSLGIETRSKK